MLYLPSKNLICLERFLQTSVDLINGTLPISYHMSGMLESDNKSLHDYGMEEMYLNDLNLTIEKDYILFLAHNETDMDLITKETASFQAVRQTMGDKSCTL